MTSPVIQFRNVSKQYPYFQLKNIDLDLDMGQWIGLIGQNGAGKSTTIRIMMGLVQPDAGDVKVLGFPIPEAQVQAKFQMGYLSEDMRLFNQATLAWHMSFMEGIYPTWDQTYAAHLVKKFRLNSGQKLKGFSHGQRVKAGLLLVLARRPKLLILDEPTTGLDPVAKKTVLEEMLQLLAEEDQTIVFSSHTTQDIEKFCDQIVFIDEGRILASKDKESFLESWRRLQCLVPPDQTYPVLNQCLREDGNGSLQTFITDRYDAQFEAALKEQGVQIQNLWRLTLEEIFIAQVEMGRKASQS